jgi:hypothetical protein
VNVALARTLPVLAVAALAMLTGAPPGSAHVVGATPHWEYTFRDTEGDQGAAPDITGLEVCSDNTGLVTFHLEVTLTDKAGVYDVFVDSDDNVTTGENRVNGADYLFETDQATNGSWFMRWNSGSKHWEDAPATTLQVEYADDGLVIRVNRSELGNATKIRVGAQSMGARDANGYGDGDLAPNKTPLFKYDLSPLELTTSNYAARWVGHEKVLTMAARRSDTGTFVGGSEGKIDCSAQVGGRVINATQFGFITRNGIPVAECRWSFAKALKGRPGLVSMIISYGGRMLLRQSAFTVK